MGVGSISRSGNETNISDYLRLGKPIITNSSSDQKDGIPWYSIGFDSGARPFFSGYYGMIFRAASGQVTMDSGGRMTGPAFTQSSDIRLKSNIHYLGGILEKIGKLKPCSYTLNADKTQTERVGLIAQELEEVFPQFVYTDQQGYKSIDYASMVAVCIKAIQELS